MNIVLINHYAGAPHLGMEFRPFYMAKEWTKMGHNVTIIAASQAHVRTVQKEVCKPITKENIDGIEYLWVKTPSYNGNGFKRIINIFAFVRRLMNNAKTISKEQNPDVVIASSTFPFDIFPAKKIAKLSNARIVFEVHDLWPLSPIELGGMSKNHPFIKAVQFGEDYAYKNANHVVSMLPKTKEYMISRGMHDDKFHYVPNGINLADWSGKEGLPESHLNLINKLKSDERKIICYAGSHGIANALDSLIEAANLLEHKNVAIVLVGKGPEKEMLQNKVVNESIDNVYFLPPVKKQQIPCLLESMDFLYIGLQRQSLFRFGISPNKMFDYMMAAKPIIQAIEAGNNMVEEAKCGIAVEPENPQDIQNAVLKLMNYSSDELTALGTNGQSFVLKNHEYSILAKKFIDILTNY